MRAALEDIALFRAALMAMPYAADREARHAAAHRRLLHPSQGRAAARGHRRGARTPRSSSPRRARTISELELPAPVRDMTEGQKTLSAFDGPRAHADEARRFPHLLSESLEEGQARGRREDRLRDLGRRPQAGRDRPRARSMRCSPTSTLILTAPAPGEAPLGLETHRQGHLQPSVDLSLDAVRDPALHQGPDRPAGRHPAGRPPARGRARCSTSPPGCRERSHEAAQRHRSRRRRSRPARSPRRRWCAPASSASPSASPAVKAWAYLDPDLALAQAKRGRRGQGRRAARRAGGREGHHRHPRHADRPQLADLRRARCRSATPPAWRSAGPPMP